MAAPYAILTRMVLLIVLLSIAISVAIISTFLGVLVKKALRNDNRKLARLILGLLVLQFILGMMANLFVTIPTTESWRIFHEFGPVLLHTLNALYLLIFSIIFLVNAIRKDKQMRAAAVTGCIAVIVAFTSGVIFVNHGQQDAYSFAMALGFITALMAYAASALSGPRTK